MAGNEQSPEVQSPEVLARILALKNAVRHKGRASPKALVGGMLAVFPSYKEKMKELFSLLDATVAKVNTLSQEEQERELRKARPDYDKKEEKGLKPLPGVEESKPVVLRFEPSPSGPLHIGHAYPLSLNLEYARRYNGTFILRIADTNPENISEDAYDLIPEDASWLAEGKIDTVLIQSDRVERYYQYAEQLLRQGDAYVCTCKPESFKKLRDKGAACPCRERAPEEHLRRWERMLAKSGEAYPPGGAVVRFKTIINHKNPAMRDFPILRINEHEHPRQGRKYRVWPLMNFSVAIDDMEGGVTHTLRGKDHADNAKKQAFIHKALGYETPIAISVGRINFEGFPVSCSKTRPLIEKGELRGWDDPRIPFLPALRRRGYHPRALRNYALEVGLSKNDKSVALDEFFKHINALNKELIDPVAERYFFVANPVEILVEGAPHRDLELDLHPDTKKGGRRFTVGNDFFISGDDYAKFQDLEEGAQQKVRFMENMTVIVEKRGGKVRFTFDQEAYQKEDVKDIIHWLPNERLLTVNVIMPDASVQYGLGEESLQKLSPGSIVQFERFGFCRFDRKEGERLLFYYAHR